MVKIGGSQLAGASLERTLAAVERHAGRVAVVPGGGRFADQVRDVQAKAGLDDATAHCMALLAMAQYGFLLAAYSPVLAVAPSVPAAVLLRASGKVPVWAPLDLVLDRTRVPEVWEMSSDSLALYFAVEARAARLVLLKAAAHEPGVHDAAVCARRGLIDALFSTFLEVAGLDAYWIGDSDAGRLEAFLDGDDGAAARLTAGEARP